MQFGGQIKCYAFLDVPDAQPSGTCTACPLPILALNKCGATTFAAFYDIYQVGAQAGPSG